MQTAAPEALALALVCRHPAQCMASVALFMVEAAAANWGSLERATAFEESVA